MNIRITTEWVQKFFARTKRSPKRGVVVYWEMMVGVFSLLLLLVLGAGVFFFVSFGAKGDEPSDMIPRKATDTVARDLADTLLRYQQKKEAFESLRANPPSFVDPSR